MSIVEKNTTITKFTELTLKTTTHRRRKIGTNKIKFPPKVKGRQIYRRTIDGKRSNPVSVQTTYSTPRGTR